MDENLEEHAGDGSPIRPPESKSRSRNTVATVVTGAIDSSSHFDAPKQPHLTPLPSLPLTQVHQVLSGAESGYSYAAESCEKELRDTDIRDPHASQNYSATSNEFVTDYNPISLSQTYTESVQIPASSAPHAMVPPSAPPPYPSPLPLLTNSAPTSAQASGSPPSPHFSPPQPGYPVNQTTHTQWQLPEWAYQLVKRIESLEGEIQFLKRENNMKTEQMYHQSARTDEMENRSRGNELLFSGVKEEFEENVTLKVRCILYEMGLNDHMELEAAYRLGPYKESTTRSICVIFCYKKDRDMVKRSSGRLKGSNVYINEHLC